MDETELELKAEELRLASRALGKITGFVFAMDFRVIACVYNIDTNFQNYLFKEKQRVVIIFMD